MEHGGRKISSSYVLMKRISDEEVIYFKEWIKKNSKNPAYSSQLRFARHWKEKTNCKRFLGRNNGVLKGFEVERCIQARHCYYCGFELDREMQTSAKYCSEECRLKAFKES